MHWAKSKEIVEALIDSGCVVNARNFQGDTALHVMVRHGRLECVLALVTCGADIDAKDNAGNTSLHLAADMGHTTILRALLVFDADSSLTNNQGKLPWTVAAEQADAGIADTFQFKDRLVHRNFVTNASIIWHHIKLGFVSIF